MNRIDLINKCVRQFGAYWFYEVETGQVNSVDGWLNEFEEVKDDEALECYNGDGVEWFEEAAIFDTLRGITDIDNSLDDFLSYYTDDFKFCVEWFRSNEETPENTADYLLQECLEIGYPEYGSLMAVIRFMNNAKKVANSLCYDIVPEEELENIIRKYFSIF